MTSNRERSFESVTNRDLEESRTHRVIARRLKLDGDGQADLGEHRGEQREVMVDQTEAIAIGNPISAGITSSADSSRRILPLTYNWRRGIRGDPAARYVLSGFE